MLQNSLYLAYSHSENLNSYLYSATPINQINNSNDSGTGILQQEEGTIDTGNGNDLIAGISSPRGTGLESSSSTINTGHGDDTISGNGSAGILIFSSIFNTDDGNDIIIGNGNGSVNTIGIFNFFGNMDTGNGNDIIAGTGADGIVNLDGTINTGYGEDSIISKGKFLNSGNVFLGEGNDSIIADTDLRSPIFENFNFIGTGDGNDIITSTGVIYNQGVIETGNGDDSIIVDGGIDDITGTTYGIYNNGGAINMGDGNDSIIASDGFKSGENSSGAWFLGEGDDYIKGFGSGDFYGGNGFDKLELTPGSYTLKKWADNTGESVVFTQGNSLMITSEFEQLIAGGTTYDFASLTDGQIIVIA
jgi:hypothetical protein